MPVHFCGCVAIIRGISRCSVYSSEYLSALYISGKSVHAVRVRFCSVYFHPVPFTRPSLLSFQESGSETTRAEGEGPGDLVTWNEVR